MIEVVINQITPTDAPDVVISTAFVTELLISEGPPGGVNTVFGRTGNVIALSGDYNTDLVIEGAVNKYDKTVSLTAGANTTITGSYPNFTISSTGGGGGGSGTVTSVSVTTQNGVSASVTNPTTTPALAFTLGAITPTSVAASGTLTGSNLSGINTGDQTSVTGNAGTATKLATARTINGTSFDGTANITITAAASTINGLISQGTNVTITGTGTSGSPYVINSTGGGGGGTPGGSTTQLQYNNAGAFGGMARATTDGNDLILVPQATPAFTAWKVTADSTNRCLTVFNADSNVSMQVGKEGWVTVYNNSGSTIANGKPVYATGFDATTGWITIAQADASAAVSSLPLGLTTQSIANNTVGEVCFWGDVHDFDTSAFTAGATVYLGTTPGALTTTAPVSPNYHYRIGKVGRSNATTGYIQVMPSTARIGNGTNGQVLAIGSTGLQEYKTITESIGFTVDGGGVAIPTGKVKGFFTSPYSGTISGWAIVADTGTVTVKVWKVATGTAKPTSANSINTSGVSLTTGTAIRSTTLTDFTTTAVSAFDIFAYNIEAASGVTELTFNLFINR